MAFFVFPLLYLKRENTIHKLLFNTMKKLLFLFCLLTSVHLSALADSRLITDNWNFYLGEAVTAYATDFNDVGWRLVQLPHDWAFECGYQKDGIQGEQGGYACGGVGWYRKKITLTQAEMRSLKVFLDFDAVYMNAQVWFNGHYLGKNVYGYVPFSYEVTPYVQSGENSIVVRVDNSQEPSARWYHGCGIYADVHLRTHGPAYFEKEDSFIYKANEQGELGFHSEITASELTRPYSVALELCDARGEILVQRSFTPVVMADHQAKVDFQLKIKEPQLWCPEHPYLYRLSVSLYDNKGKLQDTQRYAVGFRSFAWSPRTGFHLNGKPYKLHGVCDHLEGGPVGAAYTPQLLRWKLNLLKQMGCNAIRTAHNPQIPAFYDLCDELGILVMDEVFDGWKQKAPYDYGHQAFPSCWERDLRTIIRRDRNHTSVFLYSVGNETSGSCARDLVRVCHEEDTTRLVTSGSAGTAAMDIVGMNGGSETPQFLATYQPGNRAFMATENPHTWQVRGYYRTRTWYRDGFDKSGKRTQLIPDLTAEEIFSYDWAAPGKKHNSKQVFNSSYDNATVRANSRRMIEAVRDNGWFSGSFRWTGFDYLGEAGYVHGGWPFRAFQSGALDLAGFPKDLYYLYQSEWTTRPFVHLFPHWTHPMMKEGTLIPIWAYTTGDEVELLFNGRSLGRRKKGKSWNQMQCEFLVPWHPGKLEAVAYREGREIARSQQVTAGVPSQITIETDSCELKADKKDVRILTIRQTDEAGVLYPYGENRVHVALHGPVQVLSFENGNPVDTETNYHATSRRCFFGLNRLFLQSTGGSLDQPVSVGLGVISGDKQLKLSNRVTLLYKEISLRGKRRKKTVHIHYTTDGSEPNADSPLYTGSFSVGAGTTVKAAVYEGKHLLMKMNERFGPGEGLYWGKLQTSEK